MAGAAAAAAVEEKQKTKMKQKAACEGKQGKSLKTSERASATQQQNWHECTIRSASVLPSSNQRSGVWLLPVVLLSLGSNVFACYF